MDARARPRPRPPWTPPHWPHPPWKPSPRPPLAPTPSAVEWIWNLTPLSCSHVHDASKPEPSAAGGNERTDQQPSFD
uniref:Uncharacterized protein n=1 Tax=Zea mays TaxID=4577 RepID=B4FJ29_MAIZE|nr:unknown [Zea mays]